MPSIRFRSLTALAIPSAAAIALAGCGSDAKSSATTTTPMPSNMPGANVAAPASDVDAAFVREMASHHQLAVDMAAIAKHRAKNRQVKLLAITISTVQQKEIKELDADAKRLKVTLNPSASQMAADAKTLGIPMTSMGMSMDPSSLKTAKDFDQAFLSEMIPHHVGAVTMARVETTKGSDPQLKALATKIVAEQNPQLGLMAQLRAKV